MEGIHPRTVWSHNSNESGAKETVAAVRRSTPLSVTTFSELVERVAEITYRNPEDCIFYRGQSKDHRDKTDGTSIYPTIFRKPDKAVSDRLLHKRFEKLANRSQGLLDRFKSKELIGREKLKFQEVAWAILQHYESCATPLLDVTTSIRVAASFATNFGNQKGVFYCLGFPNPTGGISYSVESELLTIRLLSICPPKAKRPYFQEGFLVGSFPSIESTKSTQADCARRLIAKFEVGGDGFWTQDFPCIPEAALKPVNDEISDICQELSTIGSNTYKQK